MTFAEDKTTFALETQQTCFFCAVPTLRDIGLIK